MDKMQAIIRKIRDLEIEFQKSQGLILTEEDLQCNVFRKIYDLFYHDLDTMDRGVRGSQLHSELKFFDDQDKLSIVPDITILDTARLSILHSVNTEVTTEGIKYEKYRTKQFEFGGNVTVIELKFCRSKGGITNRDISRYKSDLSKMKNLAEIISKRSEGVNSVSGLFVVFNRTDVKVAEFEELMKLDSEKIKIVYATGKLKIEGDSDYLVKF